MKIIWWLALMKHHFNRSLKFNYSWFPKGINSQIININVKGTWSIISALFSNWQFLVQIVKSTVNQDIFHECTWILYYWLKFYLKEDLQKVLLILDNASTYSSIQTHRLFSLLELRISYLPPYSPKLAAVELLF